MRSLTPIHLALWVLTLVIAFWLGLSWKPSEVPTATHQEVSGTPLDASELRRIIREELAQRAMASAGEPGDRADAPALDAATQARADEGAQIIERAISAGQWTSDDSAAFAAVADALPPSTLIELQRALHLAINRGQVTTVDGLPPFSAVPPPPAPRQ